MERTDFKQYIECSVCKIHHNIGHKHLYTKAHKNKLKIILKKSYMKVSETKRKLNHIEVHDEMWEKDSNFWCYFCDVEYPKHHLNGSLMIQNLGYVNHFANLSHYNAVKLFFKKNREQVDSIDKYCIKKSELIEFLDKVPKAKLEYEQEIQSKREKDVSQIRQIELARKSLVEETLASSSFTSSTTIPTVSSHQKAYAQLDKPDIPPWLTSADPTSIMKPTIEDLQKHEAKQKSKGLPVKRVGANFVRGVQTSSKWLPSFSGIWNKKRSHPYHKGKCNKRKNK